MLVSIDIDVVGLTEVIAKLDGMKLRSTNFTPVFMWARERLGEANAENFASGGLPVGGWAARAPGEHPWPLMHRTGELAGSLIKLAGPPNTIGATEAEFGTSVKYARFHQNSTWKMPKRQIVFEPVGFAAELADEAVDWIVARGSLR